jgi:hypothetical protein
MRDRDDQQSRTPGVCLILAGLTLAAAAALAGLAAADHMAAAAALCGPALSHCILCVASAGSLLASAGVATAGAMLLSDRPSPQRAGRVARRST